MRVGVPLIWMARLVLVLENAGAVSFSHVEESPVGSPENEDVVVGSAYEKCLATVMVAQEKSPVSIDGILAQSDTRRKTFTSSCGSSLGVSVCGGKGRDASLRAALNSRLPVTTRTTLRQAFAAPRFSAGRPW